MKKVLFINHTNDVFGAETVLLEILKSIEENNRKNIYVLEPRYKDSEFRKKVEDLGIRNIVSLPYKNLRGSLFRNFIILIYNIYAVIRTALYIKKNHIDIIYSNTSITCLGSIVARISGKEHFWHIHEPFNKFYISKGSTPFLKRLFAYNKNKFIFVSRTQEQEWKSTFRHIINSQVIYNPIKLADPKKHIANDYITFGYIGSLSKRKNIDTLLKSFCIEAQADDKIRLLITDNCGDYQSETHKIVENNSAIKNKVIFTNNRDTSDFFSSIDVLVLPSYSETWGMVVTEAMVAGIPTIATKASGLIDIFENDKDTIFIDPHNINSIASAIKEMTNENTRRRLSEAAIQKIESFDFNNKFATAMRSLFA